MKMVNAEEHGCLSCHDVPPLQAGGMAIVQHDDDVVKSRERSISVLIEEPRQTQWPPLFARAMVFIHLAQRHNCPPLPGTLHAAVKKQREPVGHVASKPVRTAVVVHDEIG